MGKSTLLTLEGWVGRWNQTRIGRVLRHADFRLLWIGAFLSFTGSWVQNVAQSDFVYTLTRNETKLAFVNFMWSLPVLVFGLFAGSFTDHMDKRAVLIWTQILLGIFALFLAAATFFGFVQYWHIILISFLNGLVSCVEMPTRQSVVSRVVPEEDLAAAVPVNAMTFNVARIFGPAIGGVLLASFGVATCYLFNGLSYIALVWSATKIKSDLTSHAGDRGPLKDLIFEGAIYTFRDVRLRTLLILESFTAIFGLTFMPLLTPYVRDVLRPVNAQHSIGLAFTWVGVGAFVGLLIGTHLAESKKKERLIRWSMAAIAAGLLALSVVRTELVAFPILAVMGTATIMQLSTTNGLFQILAPERLRGRVLAMHIWALNGLSPFGVILMGWIANSSRMAKSMPSWTPTVGVPLAYQVGGVLMVLGTIGAYLSRRGLSDLHVDVVPYR